MKEQTKSLDLLTVSDWTQQISLEFSGGIETDRRVGELVAEAVHKMDLPRNTPYSAIHEGVKLNSGDTLEEAGITNAAQITLAPEVSAG